MWISKPIYESLPYFYLVAGLVVLLKRRDFRSTDKQRNAQRLDH